jgi:ectoine hydroxylase
MKLSPSQVNEFEERGVLLFPGLLDDAEVGLLQREVPALLGRSGPEVVPEQQDPSSARLVFAPHQFSEPFRHLVHLPRILNPVQQLLGEDVYLYQSRLNPKPGFGGGGAWDWHQDYPPWHTIDGVPQPRMIMASVFIDDCTPVTSPLLVIPGSQRHGLLDAELHSDAKGRGYSLHTIEPEVTKQLAEEHGIEALVGPAGSVALVHVNVLHGSANNVSPWRRAIVYLIYNAVSNACTRAERQWYQCAQDFTPLVSGADDSLKC